MSRSIIKYLEEAEAQAASVPVEDKLVAPVKKKFSNPLTNFVTGLVKPVSDAIDPKKRNSTKDQLAQLDN